MTMDIRQDAPPFSQDAAGAVRISGTRVLLELVIRAFRDGATPEAIVQRYPTLRLPDAYATVAYYLRHTEEVESYLADREQVADGVRQRVEAFQGDLADIRGRLLARRPA